MSVFYWCNCISITITIFWWFSLTASVSFVVLATDSESDCESDGSPYAQPSCSSTSGDGSESPTTPLADQWYIDKVAVEGPCNIDVRSSKDLSQSEFIDVYAYSKPVIITYSEERNKVFRKECNKEHMLRKYGEKIIRLSSANTHSYRKRDVTLQYYIDQLLRPQDIDTLGNETFYWFGDNNYTEWQELFDLYRRPHVSLPGKEGMYSFGMAGAGTGVPFHWHGPGFGEVVFGRKRWFLFPPEKAPQFNPDKTTLYWLFNGYQKIHPSEMPLECTLRPGQAIYFPDRWWHATLNLDTSIFISTFLG